MRDIFLVNYFKLNHDLGILYENLIIKSIIYLNLKIFKYHHYFQLLIMINIRNLTEPNLYLTHLI